MENKSNVLKIVVGAIAVVIVGVGLVFLARGSDYPLTVQHPVMGKTDAPIVIEEFADFQCPACRLAAVAVEEIIKLYPNQVQVVYKHFPIPGHEHARFVAAASVCAAQQNAFPGFYKDMFAKQTEWAAMDQAGVDNVLVAWAGELKLDVAAFNECRASRTVKKLIETDYQEGTTRTVNSTPTFFIDGEKHEGGLTVFQWIQKINAALEKKGLTPEAATPTAPQPKP